MGKKARSTASAAADNVAGNTDMLGLILIRVPLKPLVRLKCVSKQWKALISDQQFLDSHSLHYQQQQHHQRCFPNSLIFSNYSFGGTSHILSFTAATTITTPNPNPRVLNLDFVNNSGDVVVVHSCNGLLLCRNAFTSTYYCYICNPITRDFTTLDLRRHPLWAKNKSIHLYLAFDPSISPHYKVVSLMKQALNSPCHWVFNVYTFKTRTRISIDPGVSVETPFALKADEGVYCNGAIHWCNKSQFSVYFDVDTQCLGNYPMPQFGSKDIRYFAESGGYLHLMLGNADLASGDYDFELFELKQDYSGWLLKHRVDLKPLIVEFPSMPRGWNQGSFHIVYTAKDKNKKSSMLALMVGAEGAICYDPVDKTSTKLCDFEERITPLPARHGNGLSRRVLLHCAT